MNKCSKCSAEFEGTVCPDCGTSAKTKKKPNKKLIAFIVVGVIMVGLIGGVISTTALNADINNAYSLIEEGQYTEAKEIIDRQLGTNDSFAKVHILHADYYLAQDDYKTALAVLDDGRFRVEDKDALDEKASQIKENYSTQIEAEQKAAEEKAAAEEASRKKAEEEKKKQEAIEASKRAEEMKYTLTTEEKVQIQTWAKETVKERLKAPSTAKFPGSFLNPYEGWGFTKNGNHYEVSGYVVSQNSFGAMIRSNFYMEIEWNKETGIADISNIQIE